MACVLFVSCSDDKIEEVPYEGVAELKSFGFYAEDNEGVLTMDYIAEEIASEMKIRLPEGTNKSALVARFTTADDNVVAVGTTLQVSGETPNNFEYPIDFVVKNSENNTSKSYSVEVGKILKRVWSKIGQISATDAGMPLEGDVVMRINPKDNTPYIAYIVEHTTTVEGEEETIDKVSVAKWTGSAFEKIGASAFTNQAADIDITFDADGVPYLLYLERGSYRYNDRDYTADMATVLKYANSKWNAVGEPMFSLKASTSTGICIAIDPVSKQPVVMTVSDDRNADAAIIRRNLEFSSFNGSAWTSGQKIPDRPAVDGSTHMSYKMTAKTSGNDIYFGMANNGSVADVPNGNTIYKYANGTWSTIVDGGFMKAGASATSIQDFSFDIASNGDLYALSADDVNGGIWHPRLFKYSNTDQTTAEVGGTLEKVVESRHLYRMTLDHNDTPFAIYVDNTSELLKVVNIDSETKQWSDPMVLSDVLVDQVGDIEFDKDNNGFVVGISDDADTRTILLYGYLLEADE